MSSVPDYAAEAALWLNYAKESMVTKEPNRAPRQDDLALAQTNATIGLGYAVLALFQQLPRQDPR